MIDSSLVGGEASKTWNTDYHVVMVVFRVWRVLCHFFKRFEFFFFFLNLLGDSGDNFGERFKRSEAYLALMSFEIG